MWGVGYIQTVVAEKNWAKYEPPDPVEVTSGNLFRSLGLHLGCPWAFDTGPPWRLLLFAPRFEPVCQRPYDGRAWDDPPAGPIALGGRRRVRFPGPTSPIETEEEESLMVRTDSPRRESPLSAILPPCDNDT
jgi:hypothetical protein